MKEQTARELYKALNNACTLLRKAGKTKGTPYDMDVDAVMEISAKLFPGVPRQLVNIAAEKGAMEFFRKTPEPSEEKKAHLITMIGDMPFILRRVCSDLKKELPYRRGKRTPEKLNTAQKRKEACNDVARLLSCGVEKKNALTRVSEKYGSSSRTIRRLWEKYLEAAKASAPAR